MMTNTQLLAIAKKQLGNGGSKYRKYVGASGNYCNMFVYWLFNANGCASLFPLPATKYYRTYCPDSIKWCRKNLAEIPPYIAMACDIIYMDWEPNGVPNHIGIVDHKVSTTAIATIEGNTSGGIVAAKTRNTKYTNIFRPHFNGTYKKVPLIVDGDMGYQTIGGFQVVLGLSADTILGIATVKKAQAWAGAKQDGAWGKGTSKCIQSKLAKEGYYTGKIDSEFGKQSVVGLQKYCNAKLFTVKTTKPAASKPAAPKKIHYFGHCANRKLDCVKIQFKYSAKSGDAKHWTYVAVWKDTAKGEKAAQFVEQCIARNPRIQYDDKPNLKKKLIANKGKMPSGALTANCSNLMAAAIYYASGKEIADKGAKGQKEQLKKSGLFNIYTDDRRKGYVQRGAIYGCQKHTGMSLGKK